MFKKSITTLCVTLASVLLFTSCANSSLKTLNFDSMMDIVSSYSEKEKYFLSTTTFKMSYTLIEDNSKIEGMYELDYDKDSYYLYHLVRSDDGVKERLIYKNEDNQYVEYIHGKNITSTENYVERMNEVRSVIRNSPFESRVQIFSRSKNTPIPYSFSLRICFSASTVFLAKRLTDFVMIRSIFPSSASFTI